MKLYLGTSGYSYKEWKGWFYPEDLPASKMLEYYSRQFSSVEVNNTFYRMPKAEVVAGWRETVPESFRFVLKANMRLTHRHRLKEAGESLAFMTSVFSAMEERLGAVLYQLPPNFKKDMERLEGFLEILPPETRAAFEFRHPTWFDDETYACLGKHGCALVVSDNDEEPPPRSSPCATGATCACVARTTLPKTSTYGRRSFSRAVGKKSSASSSTRTRARVRDSRRTSRAASRAEPRCSSRVWSQPPPASPRRAHGFRRSGSWTSSCGAPGKRRWR